VRTHYQPVEDGYQIVGSREIFNRALYGGHEQDDLPERYFTYAGDQPLVMGAVTDWRKRNDCTDAKCGTLMLGVAMTPGVRIPLFFYAGEQDGDRYSQWFHDSPGTVSTFRNGWMEHEIWPFFQCSPSVRVKVKVLPLMPDAGFLYHLRVSTDQHVHLAVGFGGITDYLGRLELPVVKARNFSPENCRGNKVTPGKNRAYVKGSEKNITSTGMWVGASFPVKVTIGDSRLVEQGPGKFLSRESDPGETPMARMECEIGAGQTLEGFIVVIRNSGEEVLDRWLSKKDPVGELQKAIREKHSVIEVRTPDRMLDLTVPPTVLAMDACWHKDAFCHGTYAWHCPYMGWRNWYGPTVIGWHERVEKAIRTHAATRVTKADTNGPEEIVDSDGNQYHRLKNSYGFIPEIPDGRKEIFYNMQEVYVDHYLHHLDWTHCLDLAKETFDVIADVLAWEARILDPDGDGLYQNWLNTWISDAHSYNGGGCAQSSAYNYRANKAMAGLARKLGFDPAPFLERAEKIKRACREILWQPGAGVLAEYVDTVGNKLIHASPELATAYHAIEAGLVDFFQAYQMLRFTETEMRNERTAPRGGRLVWSSNWYPQNYSSCGLYTAENQHLAWAYFAGGWADKGNDILKAIVDAYFMSENPGMASHCMAPGGYANMSQDFSEIASMHLRVIVEGLFGVRFSLLDNLIEIAPNFPAEWKNARLRVRDIAVEYNRKNETEILNAECGAEARKVIKLPLRGTKIEKVEINGLAVDYRVESGIGRSYVVVETEMSGKLSLSVSHGRGKIPAVKFAGKAVAGRKINFIPAGGEIIEYTDPSGCLREVQTNETGIRAVAGDLPGWHTVFVRVRKEQWDGWLPLNLQVAQGVARRKRIVAPDGKWVPVDMAGHYNIALDDIHRQEYLQPRPAGYSIMMRVDGRFGWDWNQGGYCKTAVDDKKLRTAGGRFVTESGIPFSTPASGKNAACVSLWENFTEAMTFSLSGRGTELAVFMIGVTNPMQSRVESGRLILEYADGKTREVALVPPVNFDDWLVAAVQTENETVYFSDYNHGLVQRFVLDASRDLKSLTARAVANETVIGILGVAIRRRD